MPYASAEKRREYHREYMRTYNRPDTPERQERLRAQWRAWHRRNKERRNKRHREVIQALRIETLMAYGGLVCACCGEQGVPFLCLDHIHNNGAEERRLYGPDGAPIWRRLRRAGWPPGYQVLCYNCNNGKRVNSGVCPHKETR